MRGELFESVLVSLSTTASLYIVLVVNSNTFSQARVRARVEVSCGRSGPAERPRESLGKLSE